MYLVCGEGHHMICEQCKYVFRAEDAAVSLFDRRIIVEHLRGFAALTTCPRCGHMRHVEQYGHDIRRYKATCDACKRVRDASDVGMVAIDGNEKYRKVINGLGSWVGR